MSITHTSPVDSAQELPLGVLATVTQGLNISGARGTGRRGGWELSAVESGDIQDDLLALGNLRTIAVEHNVRNERHLIKAYDVLVTARSNTVKVALVSSSVDRTVAGATLLVVRPDSPELGAFLWYFLTSSYGRTKVRAQVTTGATIASLSAKALGEVRVPVPAERELHRLADVVEASERAYAAGLEAVQLRRSLFRDRIIDELRTGGG